MAYPDDFPTQDITFRSGRLQGDWDDNTPTQGIFKPVEPPVSLTLENVIQYFKNKPTMGVEARINKATAQFLEELRELKVQNRHDSQNGVDDSVESEIQAEIDAGL